MFVSFGSLVQGWRSDPMQPIIGRDAAQLRPLRAGHQLSDRCAGTGEAAHRSDAPSYARDDGPLRRRSGQDMEEARSAFGDRLRFGKSLPAIDADEFFFKYFMTPITFVNELKGMQPLQETARGRCDATPVLRRANVLSAQLPSNHDHGLVIGVGLGGDYMADSFFFFLSSSSSSFSSYFSIRRR